MSDLGKTALRLSLEWWDMGHLSDEKFAAYATEGHCGDCTKEPCACNRCFADDVKKDAEKLLEALRTVQRETAEECIRMAIAEVESAPELADAIKARFGLDKEEHGHD